jgi:ATP-dependent DNA helicase RecQ
LAKPQRSRGGAGTRAVTPNADGRPPVEDSVTLSPGDTALLARLKALRTEIAREERVPPYIVFPDRTLAEIALRRPKSDTAMANIRGVGPAKLERYGPRFLEIVASTTETEAA